ncbi:hypothetical protein QBC43DRAFT_102157 [Cladorrhinum sp. PSN259]|nr:hypothetical protein QBC43DRAFT_102157 [Cladorrhinum sp. PSN259]
MTLIQLPQSKSRSSRRPRPPPISILPTTPATSTKSTTNLIFTPASTTINSLPGAETTTATITITTCSSFSSSSSSSSSNQIPTPQTPTQPPIPHLLPPPSTLPPQLHTKKHHDTYSGLRGPCSLPLFTKVDPLPSRLIPASDSQQESLFPITLYYPFNRACTIRRSLDDFLTLQNAIQHIRGEIKGTEGIARFRQTVEGIEKEIKRRDRRRRSQRRKQQRQQLQVQAQQYQGFKDGLERGFLLGVQLGLRLGEQRGSNLQAGEEGEQRQQGQNQLLEQHQQQQPPETWEVFVYHRRGSDTRRSGSSTAERDGVEEGILDGDEEQDESYRLINEQDMEAIQRALDEFLRDVLNKTAGSSPGVEWFLKRREGDCTGY